MKARLVYENKEVKTVDVVVAKKKDKTIVSLPAESVGSGVGYVDFLYDYFSARVGDEGWFLTDAENTGTALTYFTPRENSENVTALACVPCYGWNNNGKGVLGIITGMRADMVMVIGVADGVYYTYPRILLEGDIPYEDITAEFYEYDEASYAAMACTYREYVMKNNGCERLSVRAERDERLKKSADSIAVRIRQGWKPAPSPVENQTPETEPPMHVACTFDRVGDVARKFKSEDVKNAEICLVGWNCGGHDGRFPQIFPADPRLGGTEKMKELIEETKSLGYQIVCHDDATAAYTIADCFDEEYLLKNRDGKPHARPFCWSGGRPYKICPKRQYEKFEIPNQQKLKELGFEGLHYIDVMTILPLLKCYDENHPINRKEFVDYYRKIMELSRKNFGGFSSEGSYDFAADLLDYVLYASFGFGGELNKPMYDEIVPFWYIAYHGIVLYNPSTYTLNYSIKGIDNRLKCLEVGGRPLVCYYANFSGGDNWMGKEDMLCDTEEQLEISVKHVKAMEEDYDLLKEERYLFITDHKKVKDNVFETTYENGTVVTVDYNSHTFDIRRGR